MIPLYLGNRILHDSTQAVSSHYYNEPKQNREFCCSNAINSRFQIFDNETKQSCFRVSVGKTGCQTSASGNLVN